MSITFIAGRLVVCTSCRDAAARNHGDTNVRAGARLMALLTATAGPLEVVGHACLSGCMRGCTFALQRPGHWTYLFGDCDADAESVADIAVCARLYAASPDGYLERRLRPGRLQAGVLARIPPLR